MSKPVYGFLCLLLFATACSQARIIEKPIPVEIIRVEHIPVPQELLQERPKTSIPDDLTYGVALELWARDRANLEVQNANLRAIATLEEP